MTTPDRVATMHAGAMPIDLHAHPATKTYFGNARLKERYTPDPGFNPVELRTSYPSLVDGGVSVVCSSVYVPEHFLKKDCWVIALASNAIPRLKEALNTPSDGVAKKMLRFVEDQVAEVNATNPARPMVVARTFAELEAARAAGKLVLVHTLEGAHALNDDVDNIQVFSDLGVASITLAHFYPNGFAPPVEAVPGDVFLRVLGCFRYREDEWLGLTARGKDAIADMFDRGVIVDLTHCTPRARSEAFDIPNPKHRPIVMTHVGTHALRPLSMNPTDDEIKKIAATGGVVGVIFYNYWLTGSRESGWDTRAQIIPHVRHLMNVGGEDCVAFGSDFDGMTDPPDDLKQPAELPGLTEALLAAGFTDDQVSKFLGANAFRVLREGWH